MGEYVSLKGGIAHFILMFHAFLPQILKYCLWNSFVCTFCMCYFLRLFRTLVHQTKERNIAKGKAARELSSA